MPDEGRVSRSPLVSIVTPTLNRRVYLEATIRSVLSQEYPRVEHVVVDGGSTDGTLEILRGYPHLRWVSEPDQGQTQAINKGLSLARGEILAWLNSDDLLLPGAISAAVACLRQHPEASFVYGDCQVLDAQGRLLFVRRIASYDYGVLLYGRCLINQPASFFRRGVVEAIGPLDERFDFCMDLEFWARAGRRGIVFRPICALLAASRYHPGTKTSSQRRVMLAEHRRVVEMYSPLPWHALGPLAKPALDLSNLCHRGRSLARRMWQRRDFGVMQARRARRQTSAKSDAMG